jgi:hypothetical protein
MFLCLKAPAKKRKLAAPASTAPASEEIEPPSTDPGAKKHPRKRPAAAKVAPVAAKVAPAAAKVAADEEDTDYDDAPPLMGAYKETSCGMRPVPCDLIDCSIDCVGGGARHPLGLWSLLTSPGKAPGCPKAPTDGGPLPRYNRRFGSHGGHQTI